MIEKETSYQPTPEEYKNAEEHLTNDEKIMSKNRKERVEYLKRSVENLKDWQKESANDKGMVSFIYGRQLFKAHQRELKGDSRKGSMDIVTLFESLYRGESLETAVTKSDDGISAFVDRIGNISWVFSEIRDNPEFAEKQQEERSGKHMTASALKPGDHALDGIEYEFEEAKKHGDWGSERMEIAQEARILSMIELERVKNEIIEQDTSVKTEVESALERMSEGKREIIEDEHCVAHVLGASIFRGSLNELRGRLRFDINGDAETLFGTLYLTGDIDQALENSFQGWAALAHYGCNEGVFFIGHRNILSEKSITDAESGKYDEYLQKRISETQEIKDNNGPARDDFIERERNFSKSVFSNNPEDCIIYAILKDYHGERARYLDCPPTLKGMNEWMSERYIKQGATEDTVMEYMLADLEQAKRNALERAEKIIERKKEQD